LPANKDLSGLGVRCANAAPVELKAIV